MAIKYEFKLSIGFSGATQKDVVGVDEFGYTDDEWNELSEKDQDNELHEVYIDWSNNFMDGGWAKVE